MEINWRDPAELNKWWNSLNSRATTDSRVLEVPIADLEKLLTSYLNLILTAQKAGVIYA